MNSATALNPSLPGLLVEAAQEALADRLETAAEVLRIEVIVDHSPDNGPEYYTEVTARYADGTSTTVDLDRTAFHDELIELRDGRNARGYRLVPFPILLKAAPSATA
ncbi:hypothetical protein ACFY00_33115 [Kitasatospora sp. NPDC001540]|uniref:hypothetical protein n=1 Tax=Kitasatospora sp. NPDC001540 TaxID=3364014 RepID=UPI0036842E0A